ncbi:galactosylgalactosylxylosylprotein 3-beta-glucuronosyltransferase 1-like [Tachypleus tridentatus]|uniref:galactosylgalactosylxylosylprotein 3-beta-glucuronosyltransferase 1-like n=1 Tax=Tachypleus tridentatus TaxID=6853 RepID=UPI003FD50B08
MIVIAFIDVPVDIVYLSLFSIRSAPSHTPTIHIITPNTFINGIRIADLIRFSQTLMSVPNHHWVLVEVESQSSLLFQRALKRSNVNFTYLKIQNKQNLSFVSNLCVQVGLNFIRKTVSTGVVFVADLENTFDLDLFEEIRYTQKVSVWPVGLVPPLSVSSPIVKNSKVVGFHDEHSQKTKFAMRWTGFAINIEFMLLHSKITTSMSRNFNEDYFEVKADNCTQVLAWNTKTVQRKFPKLEHMYRYNWYHPDLNLRLLYQNILGINVSDWMPT